MKTTGKHLVEDMTEAFIALKVMWMRKQKYDEKEWRRFVEEMDIAREAYYEPDKGQLQDDFQRHYP